MSLIPNAFAAAPSSTTGGAESTIMSFLPMIIIFALFWLLLIRPQQKKAKTHRAMLDALQKGDEVLTSSGIVGKITEIDGQYVQVKVADGVVMKFQRAAIADKVDNNPVAVKAK